MRIAIRAAAVAVGLVLVVGGPVLLLRSGLIGEAADATRHAFIAETARMGLVVRDVVLEGRRFAPRAAVAAAVSLQRGDPILGFDPAGVRQRLLAISWIRDARVERHLPDKVRIRIVERRPTALWQHDGKLALVDDEGFVISEKSHDIARFRDLLIVVGPDAPRHALTLIAILATEPALAKRVSAAVWVGGRRWNLELSDGVEIKLPERAPNEAWRKLARLEARDRLLEREVRAVDMRLPDRLIVRTGGGGDDARNKGRST